VANDSVTWKQVGVVVSVLGLLGGGWMTSMHAEVRGIKADQVTDRNQSNTQGASIRVIEEKVRRTETDVQEIKQDQREMNRKLDELLRRTR
jgi:hypothetical protein